MFFVAFVFSHFFHVFFYKKRLAAHLLVINSSWISQPRLVKQSQGWTGHERWNHEARKWTAATILQPREEPLVSTKPLYGANYKCWVGSLCQPDFYPAGKTCIIWKSFRRGVKQRKPFLATTRKTRVTGLQRNLIAAPGTMLIFFFHSFLQNKLIFRWHKPFIVGQNRISLDFCFLTQKH